MCSNDEPSHVHWLRSPRGQVQCGVLCLSGGQCFAYNFHGDNGKCEVYHVIPGNFSVVDRCTGYAMTGEPFNPQNIVFFVDFLIYRINDQSAVIISNQACLFASSLRSVRTCDVSKKLIGISAKK